MSNLAYLDTANDNTGWNRGPDPAVARRVEQLRHRRKTIITKANQLLGRRTVGGEYRVL